MPTSITQIQFVTNSKEHRHTAVTNGCHFQDAPPRAVTVRHRDGGLVDVVALSGDRPESDIGPWQKKKRNHRATISTDSKAESHGFDLARYFLFVE